MFVVLVSGYAFLSDIIPLFAHLCTLLLLFVVLVSGYRFLSDIVPLFAQFFVAVVAVVDFHNVVAVVDFHNVVAVVVFRNVVAGSIGDRHRSLFCRFFLSFPITLIFLFCLILSSSCSLRLFSSFLFFSSSSFACLPPFLSPVLRLLLFLSSSYFC